jgi:hypothetical protein
MIGRSTLVFRLNARPVADPVPCIHKAAEFEILASMDNSDHSTTKRRASFSDRLPQCLAVGTFGPCSMVTPHNQGTEVLPTCGYTVI